MVKALEWYEKSAKQGNVAAQINLCQIYANGHAVSVDKVAAMMWLKIANAKIGPVIQDSCNISKAVMTPSEIAKAEELAEAWRKEHRSPRPK